jgi:hypothetical protein
MKIVDSSRRQIVMAVLLGLALVGGAIRHWSPNPSLMREIGTLMLVLWLPAVGNLVGFVMRKLAPLMRPATSFAVGKPFVAQLRADLSPVESAAATSNSAEAQERHCTIVIGTEGFRARAAAPLVQALQSAGARSLDLEFLRPSVALARLPPETSFQLLLGTRVAATGRVVAWHGNRAIEVVVGQLKDTSV